MALKAFFTVQDRPGDTSQITIDIPSSTSPLNAIAFVKEAAQIVGPLVSGKLKTAGISFDVSVTGFPATADPDSDVQEKGIFVFSTVNGFLKKLGIPTIKETLFSTGSKQIDQANVDVAAFISMMNSGIDVTPSGGDTTVTPCDSRGEDLLELVEAREGWGKYRK